MHRYTDSVDLAWRIAAGEADWSQHQFIEKEHVFDALCKVHELLDDEQVEQIGYAASAGTMKAEVMPILVALRACGIDPKKLRRRIRGFMGSGKYNRAENEVIHRSKECKHHFRKAEDKARAEGCSLVAPVHLMESMLQDPGPHIKKALADFGITPENILELLGKRHNHDREKEKENTPAVQVTKPSPQDSTIPLLNRFCTDLTDQARKGKLKPIIGRRHELLKAVRTLLLHEKNNPVFLGEAGVGKTAIVEGLANRIASGNINPALHGKRIMELSLTSLVAGTKYRGEFEERINGIIKEAKRHPEIILFIDEIHTLVGAGSAEGALDASNILKPVLARGEISIIGTTTSKEYNRFIAKDHALERRFQPISIEEPDPGETLTILEGLKGRYEQAHGVRILPVALKAIVDLSLRYLPYHRFPDKAVDLMDKACVRVKVPMISYHGEIKDTECDEIDRNKMKGATRNLVIDAEVIAEVVSEETGIPLGRIREDERNRLLRLGEILRGKVIGQDDAVEKVSEVLKLARVGLKNPKRPMAVFLFLGPTGVGKTELSKTLATALFGSEDEMIRLDMSEYMERHSVARLIGAPPGYLGYEEGGQLANRLRKKPFSVVLLDEIEKAHPEVLDIFLQVFDQGRLTDGRGKTVNAKDAIFIMTSNISTRLWYKEPIGFIDPDSEHGKDARKKTEAELKKTFRPEFLNRLDEVIFFRHLSIETITKIAAKMLQSLSAEFLNEKELYLDVTDQAIRVVARKGYEQRYGARETKRVIKQMIEIPLSQKLLERELVPGQRIVVDASEGEIIFRVDYSTK